MSKKRPSKRKARYLEFSKPNVIRRPPDARPADLVKALNQAALGKGLPPGWEVEQTYRNSPKVNFKSVPVERMVKQSARRSGDFIGLYLRFLGRQADRYGVSLKQPRHATTAEIAKDEAIQERVSEREAPEFEALAKLQKRKAAAKKGAETRRRNEAARKAAKTKAKPKKERKKR